MSTALKIAIGVVVCILLVLGFAVFSGLFIQAIQVVVVLAIIAAVLRYWLVGNKEKLTPDLQAQADLREHKKAEKELKDLERQAERQRNKA